MANHRRMGSRAGLGNSRVGFGLMGKNATGAAGPTFIPTDLAGLKFWVKADSLVLNDGDPVTAWNDQSGQGKHLSQGTATNQPIYKTNVLNGKPVVRFDGVNDYIFTSSSVDLTTAFSIFIVAKNRTNVNSQGVLVLSPDGTVIAQAVYEIMWAAASLLHVSNRATVLAQISQANALPGANTFGLLEITASGTTTTPYENGVLQSFVTDTAGTMTPATAQPLWLGLNETTRCLDGDIAEVVIYGSVLSSANRALVEGYLMGKYGLT